MSLLARATHHAGVATGCLLLLTGLLNALLIPVVNPIFDPDWLPIDPLRKDAGSLRQKFARAAEYARGVFRGKQTTPWFEGGEYDYRRRVGPGALLLCRLFMLSTFSAIASMFLWIVLSIIGHWVA
jgi:hypothetical protein